MCKFRFRFCNQLCSGWLKVASSAATMRLLPKKCKIVNVRRIVVV
jgi:hypothetical protein